MKKVQLIGLVLLIAMFASIAVSCTGNAANTKSGPAIDYDTVVIATADETPSLGTATHNAVAGDYENKLTHNGLFRLDKELNPQPDLVASYDFDENSYTWTFKLHPGIKFHDGSDLTADDVVATLNYTKTMPDIATYTTSYDNVTKVDELTITLTTDGPSASLLYDLAHHGNYIIPKELIDQDADMSANPIGAGPYKFVSWDRGEKITFVAFEDYFDKERAPKIKNIIWRIIPEGSSRTIAIESGEVDYIIELDSTAVKTLDANENVTVMKIPSVSHNWLCINNEVPPFDNVNVRRAINCAINRADIIEVALNGAGVPATAQTPAGMLGENPDNFGGEYDVEKAKEYMANWGGDPSTIKLEMICSNDTKRRAAEVIQSNLKEIGIEAGIVSLDLATYLSETAAGNFTGFIGGYTSNEMMSFLKGVYHSSNIGSSNKTRTANPEVDRLIELASKTVDQKEREKVLMEVTKVLNDNCYQIPIYQDYTLSVHKKDLDNTFITSGGTFFAQEWSWKK